MCGGEPNKITEVLTVNLYKLLYYNIKLSEFEYTTGFIKQFIIWSASHSATRRMFGSVMQNESFL